MTGLPTVRDARPGDSEELLDLVEAFNATEDIRVDRQRLRPALARLLAERSLGRVGVAERDGRLAGYAVLSFGYDLEFGGPDCFITDVYVRPEGRRAGIARALLAFLEREAMAQGAGAVHLAVRPEKQGAVALYASLGFVQAPRAMMTKVLRGP
jgi:ribosomal protein S18 acetylase RimI-like enzyme